MGTEKLAFKRPKKSFELKSLHKKMAKEIQDRLNEHQHLDHRYVPTTDQVALVIDISPTEHYHAWIDLSDVTMTTASAATMEFILFTIVGSQKYDLHYRTELVELMNMANADLGWGKLWLDGTSAGIVMEYAIPSIAFTEVCAGHIIDELVERYTFWSDRAKMVDTGTSAQAACDAP